MIDDLIGREEYIARSHVLPRAKSGKREPERGRKTESAGDRGPAVWIRHGMLVWIAGPEKASSRSTG